MQFQRHQHHFTKKKILTTIFLLNSARWGIIQWNRKSKCSKSKPVCDLCRWRPPSGQKMELQSTENYLAARLWSWGMYGVNLEKIIWKLMGCRAHTRKNAFGPLVATNVTKQCWKYTGVWNMVQWICGMNLEKIGWKWRVVRQIQELEKGRRHSVDGMPPPP